MGLPRIKFNITKKGLGLLTANIQKTPGIVLTGKSVSGKITLGESRQFFSLEEAQEAGIAADNNAFAYKHIKAFYDYAGKGAELWVMLVSDATTMAQMADKEQNFAKKLLNDASGKIRVLGIAKESKGTETTANGLDEDVEASAIKLQALALEFEKKYFPFRGIISGNNFSGTVSELKDYRTTELNKVSILIANTDGAKDACVGLALGKLASIPVHRNIGRVKDGAVEQVNAYFTNGAKVESLADAWDNIADKNYIFLRNFAGKAGFFFTDDPTLSLPTDDFKSLTNGFVMDKAVIIAYNTLVENLGDEIPVSEDGSIHPALIKSWQNEVESNINGNMTAKGELSRCQVYIDEQQDVIRTGELAVQINLQPVGYAKFITINIGFTTKTDA